MAKIKKTYETGFTTISNTPFRDYNLTLKERGMLSTMMSLPDDWNFSIKGLATILQDGESSIRVSLQKLEEFGYLKRSRIYENGKVVNWEYNFSDSPIFIEDGKQLKLKRQQEKEDKLKRMLAENLDVENQHVENLGVQNLDVENQHVENLHVENLDVENRTQLNNKELNKQELRNKELNINQSILEEELSTYNPEEKLKKENDRLKKLSLEEIREEIFCELLEERTLPYNYLYLDRKLDLAIKMLSDYDSYSQKEYWNSSLEHSAYQVFISALSEMLTPSDKTMKLKGANISYSKVYDKLIEKIEYQKASVYGLYGEGFSIVEFMQTVISDFVSATETTEIKNHLQYMKACIWTVLQVGNVGVDAKIRYDLGI